MARLSLSLLGPPLVELDGKSVQLGRHKAMALLAYLALTRQSHGRDALATMLWPDLDQSAARAELRRTLSLLHRTLGSEWFAADRETVEWAPEAQVSLDVDEFRRCLTVCAAHGHPPQEACVECLPLLAQAVELYRSGFMAGFTLPDTPAFDEWQFFETEELRGGVAGALQRLARWHGARGEHEPAIGYARRWLALDVVHEPAHRALMELYARSGQRSAALRQYAECERVLAEELGAAPEEETQALYESIRSGGEQRAPSPVPADNLPMWLAPFIGRQKELHEIGARLRDPGCRLLTLVGPGGIGKTRLAVEAARQRVSDFPDGTYFVPLAGVATAEGIASATAAAIASAIAAAIGFAFYGPAEPAQQLASYLRRRQMLLVLDNCEHLFVEHLVEGAGVVAGILSNAPGVKAVVTSRARLNVQGEHLLPVGGMEYPALTPSLPLRTGPSAAASPEGVSPEGLRAGPSPSTSSGQAPTLDLGRGEVADAAQYSSVALFLDSAQRVRPGYEWTGDNLAQAGEICRLVEGMPLAILLAASWMEVLTPGEIADQVRRGLDILEADMPDLPERQRSMRAAFDVSWQLLSEAERQAFARLSVFRGGFTAEAGQAVAGADLLRQHSMLPTLRALVHKSLIALAKVGPAELASDLRKGNGGRYDVHALLRQYGAARLAEVPGAAEEAADRHCTCYAGFLQRHHEQIWRMNLEEVRGEIDNCRAAWAWAIRRGKAAEIRTIWRDAWYRNPGPGLREYDPALQKYTAALRARGLETLSEEEQIAVAIAQLDRADSFGRVPLSPDEIRALLEDGLSILRQVDAPYELAYCCNLLALLCHWDSAEGPLFLDEASAIATQVGYNDIAFTALLFRGTIVLRQGALLEAARAFQTCWEQARRLGDRSSMGYARAMLGHVALAQGQHSRAKECYEEGLAILERMEHLRWAAGRMHSHLGDIAMALGQYPEAAEHHRRALACYEDVGVHWEIATPVMGGYWGVPVSLHRLGDIALATGDIQTARQYYRQGLALAMDKPFAGLKVYVLLGPARWLARRGEVEQATELAALALHHPDSVPEVQDKARQLLAELETQLPPDAFAAAQARGRARDLEATLAELLAELQE